MNDDADFEDIILDYTDTYDVTPLEDWSTADLVALIELADAEIQRRAHEAMEDFSEDSQTNYAQDYDQDQVYDTGEEDGHEA